MNNDIRIFSELPGVSRAFIFGSKIETKFPNDIDVLLYSESGINPDLRTAGLSLPVGRIQYNCYKKREDSNNSLSYDIVVVNDPIVLEKFLQFNKGKISEC